MLFRTLLVILSVSGVLGQGEWSVTYSPERMCALKGSSVDMRCTYSYPSSHTVQKTFWFINSWYGSQEPEDLSQDAEYSRRVEYLGDQNKDCTLRIKQLRENLQAKVNHGTVTEGQRVTLTCSTTCTLTGSPAFTWYRNGSPLSFTNQKHLFTASIEDAGKYSCAVKGYEDLPSPAVALHVRYRPKNTSVSVSSSGAIEEGSSVTLTCSSDANPPVQRYTWFKNNRAVFSERGSGWSYAIKQIKYWGAGEYFCEATNEIGTDRSPHIHLKVL
ncbi:hypothetical protein SKAU_G00417940 [Synaphobranchus kaupii]|uniref:Ig-like domain-containing protein n=1 Tax=Synaphobranchus kaupii TaxID=118154 RepID=A0A9Q1E5Z9_SYNKA|nr:hypothetical protein SKAU_G00417940 [Synaphobranchus kaupii]